MMLLLRLCSFFQKKPRCFIDERLLNIESVHIPFASVKSNTALLIFEQKLEDGRSLLIAQLNKNGFQRNCVIV